MDSNRSKGDFETMDWTALDGFSIAAIDLGNNSMAAGQLST